MSESTVLRELRRALRRQGIWGPRAERLLQEWTDHVHESAAQRIADGTPAPAAEEAAWAALGQPHLLASSAAQHLTRASWLGRRPWLAGLVLPLLGWVLVMAVLLYGGMLLVESLRDSHPWVDGARFTRVWELLAQWAPWLLSLAGLARLARTLPGGWKHYWITAIVLTLLTTSAFTQIYPAPPGPRTGPQMVMTVGSGGLLGTLVNIILYLAHVVPARPGIPNVFGFAIPWVQTALSVAGLFAFRAWSCSAFPEPTRSRPV